MKVFAKEQTLLLHLLEEILISAREELEQMPIALM